MADQTNARYRVWVDFGSTNPEYANESLSMSQAYVWHGDDLAEAQAIYQRVRVYPETLEAGIDEWRDNENSGDWYGHTCTVDQSMLDGWDDLDGVAELDTDAKIELIGCVLKGWYAAAAKLLNEHGFDLADDATFRMGMFITGADIVTRIQVQEPGAADAGDPDQPDPTDTET